MSEEDEGQEAKIRQSREKFHSIEKVEISPLITKLKPTTSEVLHPDLRSPDDLQAKWHADPEEVLAARRAKARATRRANRENK